MCRGASRPQQTQQASFGHTQKLSTRKGQTSPACTQPIQEVVGHGSEVKRYGLAKGRRENLLQGSCSDSFGEMYCWDDIPPKRSKDELEPLAACHEGWRKRESTHTIVDKSATINKRTKQSSLSSDREWHGQHRQVVLAKRLINQWWSTRTRRLDKGS